MSLKPCRRTPDLQAVTGLNPKPLRTPDLQAIIIDFEWLKTQTPVSFALLVQAPIDRVWGFRV